MAKQASSERKTAAMRAAQFLRDVAESFGVEIPAAVCSVSIREFQWETTIVLSVAAAETIVEQIKALSGPLCRRPSPKPTVPPRRKRRGGIPS